MFLNFFLKMRPSSKVGTAMAGPTGPVQPEPEVGFYGIAQICIVTHI